MPPPDPDRPRPLLEQPFGVPDPPRSRPAAAGAQPGPERLPLAASVGLGFLAAFLVGGLATWAAYATGTIWFYGYLVFGFVVGTGFHWRSQPETWRIRSILAAAMTLVTLFFTEWFLTRAVALDVLTESGYHRPDDVVPLLMSPATMVRVVGDSLRTQPATYLVWACTLYVAYTVPSAAHRAKKKQARAAG